MRKVLVSYGYGAGWSSWNHRTREQEEFFLFDPEIIAAVERGDQPDLEDFERRHKERFGDDMHFYLGGAEGLVVEEVEGPFRIDEYDGAECVVPKAADEAAYF